LEETKFLRLGEIETPGLPNTILLDNSLHFLMVHFMTWIQEKLNWVAEFRRNWADLTFRHKLGFWQNFAMTFPESLHMKNAVDEHNFMSVTHMAYYDTRFRRY
jgi:hypothetical protein